MVLLMRADLKVAIPSSIIIMAFTSFIAISIKMALGTVHPDVFGNWLSAAPVVALGAPLGVLIVALIGRRITLFVVAVLCIGQFGWTMQQGYSEVGLVVVACSVLAVALFIAGFEWMWKIGDRLARRSVRFPH
jgi:hypothetical protein